VINDLRIRISSIMPVKLVSQNVPKVFLTRLGTNNFEGVLRMLEDTIWAARHYGFKKKEEELFTQMKTDLETVKNALQPVS
jgi:hypothetical protein